MTDRHLTAAEVEDIVSATVERTLERLGIDLSDAGGVRADLIFMRRSRLGAEDVSKWARRSAVTIFVSGALWALWWGFQIAIRKGGAP